MKAWPHQMYCGLIMKVNQWLQKICILHGFISGFVSVIQCARRVDSKVTPSRSIHINSPFNILKRRVTYLARLSYTTRASGLPVTTQTLWNWGMSWWNCPAAVTKAAFKLGSGRAWEASSEYRPFLWLVSQRCGCDALEGQNPHLLMLPRISSGSLKDQNQQKMRV